jgi:hypothetical protein
MSTLPFFLAALFTLAPLAAHAQSDAVLVKRPAELRDGPAPTARSLAALPVQTPLTRLPVRQGAWIQVRTATGNTGWVHMFDVVAANTPTQASNTATDALRGLSNFLNRGSAQPARPTTATSTVGIRGLGSEDIANAQPNLAALSQAEGLRTDAAQARRFAADAPWAANSVASLPTPAPPASGTPVNTTKEVFP